MSRRDRDEARARAFAARSYGEGSLSDYAASLHLAHQLEDRRRELRARRVQTVLRLPAPVLGCGFLLGVIALVGMASWASDHLLVLVPALLAVVGVVVWRRRSRPPVVAVEEVAPHDIRRQLRLDPLTMSLPAEARATVDALDPGRGRVYLEALERGLLPAPTRYRADGRDVVSIPLPGGRVAPGDVSTSRWAQTIGIEASRVRRGPDAPGVLVLDVLDIAPAELGAGPWPDLGESTDWGAPFALGVDDTGHPVSLPLAGRRVLLVGQSGSGKSRLARTIALHAAADPRVELHVADMKGSPSLTPLRARSVWMHQGPADDALVAHLRGLVETMRDRYRRMIDGEDVVSADGWVVLVVDEAQAMWRRRETIPLVEELARMGREAGMGLVLGSQLPDKSSLPTAIAEQADVRVCLRVSASWAAGLVLGEYDVDTTSLPPGHGWLNDGGGARRIVAHDVDDDAAAAHLRPLPALPPAPALPVLEAGHTGDVDDVLEDDELDDRGLLLADVLASIGEEAGIRLGTLADVLEVGQDDLRADLRAAGVDLSRKFRPAPGAAPIRGVARSAVREALNRV